MFYYALKLIVSALIIVAVSEIAKRNSGVGALLASLPLTTLLAVIWMRIESVPSLQIAELVEQVFWLVLPSLLFFIIFPLLLKQGMDFWLSLFLASTTTITAYLVLLPILRRFGVNL
ncbi:MAG: DUF3147 family protein [Methylococcaceae bacterium]|nr:DUF3147 family protein [Methylococcaceae bacterium]